MNNKVKLEVVLEEVLSNKPLLEAYLKENNNLTDVNDIKLDELRAVLIREHDVRINAYESGDVDCISVEYSFKDREGNNKYRVYSNEFNSIGYEYFNNDERDKRFIDSLLTEIARKIILSY